jgi:Anti-sigma-K factor rskA
MNCPELQDHYELYALGLAEEPERSEIRAHLNRKCEVCMPGVKRALEAAALLGTTASDAAPSGKLRDRILASVGAEPRRFSLTPFFALVAAMSVGVAVYIANQSRNAAEDARQQRMALTQQLHDAQFETARLTAAFSILNGPETKEAVFGGERPRPARGKVFLNPSQGVLLIASNLPRTPQGKMYEMWVIPKAGKPVAAGMFQSNTDGSAMHVRPGAVDVQATGAIAVTVEDQAGADQPTSTPLIMAPVESSPR